MVEDNKEVKEKSLIIKKFLLDGKKISQIEGYMKRRKEYQLKNTFVFMQLNAQYFKDISFKKREKRNNE